MNYTLKGSINRSSINHYDASLINIEDKYLGILYDKVYYYDSTKNNHCLIKLDYQDKESRIKNY